MTFLWHCVSRDEFFETLRFCWNDLHQNLQKTDNQDNTLKQKNVVVNGVTNVYKHLEIQRRAGVEDSIPGGSFY